MLTRRHQIEIFFFISLVTALSLFILVQRNNQGDRRVFSAIIPTTTSPVLVTITPYPLQTTTMDSPDGTKTLTMKQEQIDRTITYSFDVSDPGGVGNLIFSKEVPDTQVFSIPFNTWSPDNKYFFLKESSPTVSNFYVFSSSGASLPNTIQYANIQELFIQKLPDYRITDVTGWADPILIVVNAIEDKSGRNFSFWFDVTNQSFIQLGTYFN